MGIEIVVKPATETSLESHVLSIGFTRLSTADQVNKVLELNGRDNIQIIFQRVHPTTFVPVVYFTFTNKEEYYVSDMILMPAQKSLAESASEAVAEKYNALQETLTGALNSDTVEKLGGTAKEYLHWGKKLLGKK